MPTRGFTVTVMESLAQAQAPFYMLAVITLLFVAIGCGFTNSVDGFAALAAFACCDFFLPSSRLERKFKGSWIFKRFWRPGHFGLSGSTELLVGLLQTLQVTTDHCVFVVVTCDPVVKVTFRRFIICHLKKPLHCVLDAVTFKSVFVCNSYLCRLINYDSAL